MKNKNFLSKLCSPSVGSQSSDVSPDCRLTVGSPSGFHRSTMLKLVSVLAILLTIGSGNAWGAIADGTYVLCTSTSDLNSGSHYIITSGTSGTVYCIKNEVNGNNRKTVSTSFTSGKIVVGSSSTIMTFTMGGSSNAWTFYTDNYNQVTQGYLTAGNTSNKNYLQVITGGSDNKQKWTIAFGTNTTITANAGVSPYMQYNPNNGSPIFSGYRSAGAQSPVYLYKKGCSITYNCDGATSGCPDNLTAEIKLPNPLPSAPTKAGYTFDGWYTNSTKTTAAVAGASISSNTTLYAKWVSAGTSVSLSKAATSNGSFW